MTPAQVRVYADLVTEGKLDLDSLWDMMVEGEVLPDGFNREKVRMNLEAPPV